MYFVGSAMKVKELILLHVGPDLRIPPGFDDIMFFNFLD